MNKLSECRNIVQNTDIYIHIYRYIHYIHKGQQPCIEEKPKIIRQYYLEQK